MKAEIQHGEKRYEVDFDSPISIGIELKEGLENPNCYYAEPLTIEAIKSGEFIGDIHNGGPVNHKKITLSPHGNGTHTECSGHVYDNKLTITKALTSSIHLAQLISIEAQASENGDRVVSAASLRGISIEAGVKALVIRTLPNPESKRTQNYSGSNPTYVTTEAMQNIVAMGIEHLVVDLPSVDREEDEGVLAAHKTFWGSESNLRMHATITELAFIDNIISDGIYLLDLQTLMIELDASPSHPVLYSLNPI